MKRAAVFAGCCSTRLSNKFVCLFNFVNSLSLSGLLLFFAFFVVGTVGIVDPLLSLYSIYFAVFSLDSLKIR